MILSAGFLGRMQDMTSDDGAVGFGDLPFFHLIRDDLLDEVFQSEGNLGDVFWIEGGGNRSFTVTGENYVS